MRFDTRNWLNSTGICAKRSTNFPTLQRDTGDRNSLGNFPHITTNTYYQEPNHFLCLKKLFCSQTEARFLAENAHFHLLTLLTFMALKHELMLHMSTKYPKHTARVISKRRLDVNDFVND